MRLTSSLVWIISLSLSQRGIFVAADGSLDPPGLQPLVARGNAFLAAGQFNDAIKAFGEAIDLSPVDYLLYYKRATAQLSLSRHQQALDDFDKVLKLSHGHFDKALFMKAKIYAKEGKWVDARTMLKQYTTKIKGDSEAADLLFAISEAEVSFKQARSASKTKQWDTCTEKATKTLETATHNVELRHLRLDCALQKGDIEQAVADLTRITHLTSPSTSLYLRLSTLSYHLLPLTSGSVGSSPSSALQTVKQCLHRDPDSKPCASAHRVLKSLDKGFAKAESLREASDWKAIVDFLDGPSGFLKKYRDALTSSVEGLHPPLSISGKSDTASLSRLSHRLALLLRILCKSYTELSLSKEGAPYCEELLKMEGFGGDIDAHVGKGEAHLLKEEWEEAVRSFEKAFEGSGRSSRDIQSRLQKAQRLLKQSRQKDYYKVLGVARDADERTIKKAYKKAAKTAHPDKGGSEAKMAAVNEAYEVLSNPELRQRFDNGDDPNDTSNQGFGGGGNPFFAQGGGNPFMFFQNGGGSGSPFERGGGGFGEHQFRFRTHG
ncbi:TPR-like protein [Sistotremastrum suecicum HHB10207 ss-3]|uniref:TPR-like protein n=1 Tax=Sistotremastrum suecicum HHB10207 ss-3 TaxID=1314776 RepID=A0A166DNZ3_9AGAM|nr:TPR-like protein [Sistotremastrum suecicum HHB10207 ss-3]